MPALKVECLNPNTGARMNIDAEIYALFFSAIRQTLKGGKAVTFSAMVEGIHGYLKRKKSNFSGSVPWYAVTVKNDMQVKGKLEVFTEKGQKLNRLKL
ncbi:MAG: hypothetical protein H7122_20970 [Chitinophagaceae bacterium]|nr:hypothetical protein [Chitinophagaceae bacterium]